MNIVTKNLMQWFLLSLFLSGCSFDSILNNSNSSSTEKKQATAVEAVSDDSTDEYFLNIAKELFTEKQYNQAYKIARKLAEKNNIEAQYLLGYMLYYGYGVPADKKLGVKWMQKAADAGNRSAIEALVMIQYSLTPDKKCSTEGN